MTTTIEWISVKDRLPMNYREVFIMHYYPGCSNGDVQVANYDQDRGNWHDSYEGMAILGKVTHWAEIVKPTK